MASRKFHTVTVTPTLYVGGASANHKILFNPVKVPTACGRDGASLLRSIGIVCTDDHGQALDFYFMQVSKDLGTLGDVVDISDANLLLSKPLGHLQVPAALGTDLGDLVETRLNSMKDINLVVQSDGDDNDEGAIYVAAIATSSVTYTSNSMRITFGFEIT